MKSTSSVQCSDCEVNKYVLHDLWHKITDNLRFPQSRECSTSSHSDSGKERLQAWVTFLVSAENNACWQFEVTQRVFRALDVSSIVSDLHIHWLTLPLYSQLYLYSIQLDDNFWITSRSNFYFCTLYSVTICLNLKCSNEQMESIISN